MQFPGQKKKSSNGESEHQDRAKKMNCAIVPTQAATVRCAVPKKGIGEPDYSGDHDDSN
jgi:hypothetical protein